MEYFPIFLDLKGRPCLVVGGGRVGERKALSLVAAGARVTVVSPTLTAKLARLAEKGDLTHRRRSFRRGDLRGVSLAFTCANDPAVNHRVWAEGVERGIPVNVVDDPKHCTFIMPSLVSRGGLIIAISTGGRSPALAKKIRQELERSFGREYSLLLQLMAGLRRRLLTQGRPSADNKKVFKNIVESPILRLLREEKVEQAEKLLKKLAGPEFTLSRLGVKVRRSR